MAKIIPKTDRITIRGIRSMKRSVIVVVRFSMSVAATFMARPENVTMTRNIRLQILVRVFRETPLFSKDINHFILER